MDIGVRGNSRQAFVLARKRYSSGSQLYFVRWGSESVTDDAVQSAPSRTKACIEFTFTPISMLHELSDSRPGETFGRAIASK